MDSIICPIIRYDALPMYDCPFMGRWDRDYNDVLTDDNTIDIRYEASDGYVLAYEGNNAEYENNIEWDPEEKWRCDIYKNIKPTPQKSFTLEEAERIGNVLGIDWKTSKFNAEQFRVGMNVELEHGRRDLLTNVTNDDPILTGKIALAHLHEFPDYYVRLKKMEQEAMAHSGA